LGENGAGGGGGKCKTLLNSRYRNSTGYAYQAQVHEALFTTLDIDVGSKEVPVIYEITGEFLLRKAVFFKCPQVVENSNRTDSWSN
jgi:hypothetical protein